MNNVISGSTLIVFIALLFFSNRLHSRSTLRILLATKQKQRKEEIVSGNKHIAVSVHTDFLREHSDPSQKRFAFSYTVTISNNGQQSARLLTRHWVITDANGNVQEVHGEGVVGEQPLISPGRSFRYSSGAILPTPVGSMHGSYTMLSHDGNYFDTPIAPFRLAIPELVN